MKQILYQNFYRIFPLLHVCTCTCVYKNGDHKIQVFQSQNSDTYRLQIKELCAIILMKPLTKVNQDQKIRSSGQKKSYDEKGCISRTRLVKNKFNIL